MLTSLRHPHSRGVRCSIQDRINDFLPREQCLLAQWRGSHAGPHCLYQEKVRAACCPQGSRHNHGCLKSKHLEPELGSC